MTEGTVKFFNTTKGFGFIEPVGGGKDAFVHISAVERSGMSTLHEGQKVSYELETGRDGKQSATNLRALSVIACTIRRAPHGALYFLGGLSRSVARFIFVEEAQSSPREPSEMEKHYGWVVVAAGAVITCVAMGARCSPCPSICSRWPRENRLDPGRHFRAP